MSRLQSAPLTRARSFRGSRGVSHASRAGRFAEDDSSRSPSPPGPPSWLLNDEAARRLRDQTRSSPKGRLRGGKTTRACCIRSLWGRTRLVTREHANEAEQTRRGLIPAASGSKRFLTPTDIADELSVSIRTAYRLAEDIGATRIGKLVRVAREDFEKWLKLQSPYSGDLEAMSTTRGFPTRDRGGPPASRPGAQPKARRSPGDCGTSALSKIRPVRRRGPSLSKAS